MASKAKLAMNERKRKLAAKYATKRAAYKATMKDPNASEADKVAAETKLQKLPKNSSPIRIRNRCALTGRPRGFYRKFGFSRIALRERGLAGEIPGLTKSSW